MLEMDEQVITLLLEFGINPYLFFLLGYEAELQRLCVCFHNIFTQLWDIEVLKNEVRKCFARIN